MAQQKPAPQQKQIANIKTGTEVVVRLSGQAKDVYGLSCYIVDLGDGQTLRVNFAQIVEVRSRKGNTSGEDL